MMLAMLLMQRGSWWALRFRDARFVWRSRRASAVDADVMTAAVVEDMAETAATMVVTGVTTEGMTAETGAVIEGMTEVTETETEIEVVIAALIVVIAQETDMSVADPDPTLVDVARYFL